MAVLTVIGEDGQVGEVDVPSSKFYVKIDGKRLSPAVVTSVEMENDGDMSQITDQCGNTERNRVANKGWSIIVQGIVTSNDERDGNLSLQVLRDTIALASELDIRSNIFSGRIEVSNTMISEVNDLVKVETEETHGPEQAFEFQLQLGESESQ